MTKPPCEIVYATLEIENPAEKITALRGLGMAGTKELRVL
jgi:hypothetical protein